jgi:1L-myo-inositol 1-phosphate cytidylyltransferase / CDP-L-myo-inositol myo-inositolphosphotransferase
VVTSVQSVAVRDAVVLAAGNGDRFNNGSHRSKLLQPVLGQPLILRTLTTAAQAGISSFHVVVGYQAQTLDAAVTSWAPRGIAVRVIYNPEWHLENGVSVLAARDSLRNRRFALLMGDHLFEAPVLSRLLRTKVRTGESLLGVDSRDVDPEVAAEATKVRLHGDRITAIGKTLTAYDALDTGLFVCDPGVFDALGQARQAGDTTLSGGIRRLAAQRLMRAIDVGAATWCDIDTLADLQNAEHLLASQPQPEVA